MTTTGTDDEWRKRCPHCAADLTEGKYTKLIYIVDRDKDRVVAYRCPACDTQWPRSIGKVIAVADL